MSEFKITREEYMEENPPISEFEIQAKIQEEYYDNLKYYKRVHKELHGSSFNMQDVINDMLGNKTKPKSRNIGIFLGRFQPFHNGHNEIIQEIIKDKRIPVILIGGVNKKDDRHPLSFKDRKKLIKLIYPDIEIISLNDNENWTIWFKNVLKILEKYKNDDIVIYVHKKDIDKCDFECFGKKYKNAHYSDIFKDNGFKIKNIQEQKCSITGNIIHATDIRNNENIAKNNLDARIYRMLKDNYKWWE